MFDEVHPKNYQKPRDNHPWKTNKVSDLSGYVVPKKKRTKVKPVKQLIGELYESWDYVKVVTTAYNSYGEFTLNELSQSKQAAWLAGLLKKNYAQY
jgi:hypothetical protein